MTGWWTVAFIVQWLLLVALCVVVVALARQVGALHLRLGPRGALELDDEGPALGETPQPVWSLGLDGRPIRVGGPGPQRLVLFASPTCPICDEVLLSLPAASRAAQLTPNVVADPELERAWGIPGTPHVVVLDEAGSVMSKGTVNNLEQLEGLVETARHRIRDGSITHGPLREATR